MIRRNRVVITGLGVLAANGIGKEAFWNSLLAGESGIGPITLFDASDLPCQIAGELKDFNPLNYMDAAMKPRRMGRFSQLSIAASKLALQDSELSHDSLRSRGHIPIVIGVSTSDFGTILDSPKAYSTPALIPHASAASIASILHLNCELTTLSNACTSGLDAIARAADILRSGKADIALAGGTDSSITKKSFEFLSRGNMLPTDMNEIPGKASRPFDLQRAGGVLAEGSSIVVLETEQHALERGAHIYAEILGHGSKTDFSGAAKEPALALAIKSALENSSLHEDQIDYINAHAPSDPYLDSMESAAIKTVLGDRAYAIPISSIKGATGNPLGAGGCMQCVSTALAIHHSCIPPTTNLEISDPDCDLDYVPDSPRQQKITHALINSRGVSGNNSCMIFKAYK